MSKLQEMKKEMCTKFLSFKAFISKFVLIYSLAIMENNIHVLWFLKGLS
jgi:hypothetical protein